MKSSLPSTFIALLVYNDHEKQVMQTLIMIASIIFTAILTKRCPSFAHKVPLVLHLEAISDLWGLCGADVPSLTPRGLAINPDRADVRSIKGQYDGVTMNISCFLSLSSRAVFSPRRALLFTRPHIMIKAMN